MNVQFLRVVGITSRVPDRDSLVIAIVNDCLVKYSRRDGWTCGCDTEGDNCPHVDLVADLLDHRVLGDAS